MDDTDEDVDLRPRRPLLARRNVDRGVSGEGDSDVRLLGVVRSRGGGGACDEVAACGLAAFVFDVVGLGLGSLGPVRELFSDFDRRLGVDAIIFVVGDLARFADSKSQCFQCAS